MNVTFDRNQIKSVVLTPVGQDPRLDFQPFTVDVPLSIVNGKVESPTLPRITTAEDESAPRPPADKQ